MWALHRFLHNFSGLWPRPLPLLNGSAAGGEEAAEDEAARFHFSEHEFNRLVLQNEILRNEKEALQSELHDVYVELGFARQTESNLTQELTLRRNALSELSVANATLRDALQSSRAAENQYLNNICDLEGQVQNTCDKMAALEKDVAAREERNKQLVVELAANRSGANHRVNGVEALREDIVGAQEKCGAVSVAATSIVDGTNGPKPKEDGIVASDVANAVSSAVPSTAVNVVAPCAVPHAAPGAAPGAVTGAVPHGKLLQSMLKPETEQHDGTCSSDSSLAAVGLDITEVGTSEPDEALHAELERVRMSVGDIQKLMQEVTSIAVGFKRQAALYAHVKPTLVSSILRLTKLASRRTVSGKQVEPVLRALNDLLFV